MLRVKNGDEEAFAQLMTRYQNRLVAILANMVGSHETAEDLAQEAFLRVYRARNGYVVEAKFSTWLFRIAHNLAANSLRGRGRRKEVQFSASPSESGPQAMRPGESLVPEKSGMMPTRQLDRTEMQEHVRDAVLTLDERQRMAVLLHKFEEMSYVDIAAVMESSPEAVKSLLARARESLRAKLETFVKRSER